MGFRNRCTWMAALCLLWVAPALAQNVTVTLDAHGSSLGPITNNDVFYRHNWGNVLLGGQPVGTFVVREESLVQTAVGDYPVGSVLVSIRVIGSNGMLMMQGSGASVPFIGNVTVVPPGLESLLGARFAVVTAPIAGVQAGLLTLTF